jgi:hypothetical protein
MFRPGPARACLLLAATLLVPTLPVDAAQSPATETIVLVRHGEKPDAGLGQLTCQGLNRALALPKVILTLFGKPDFIFAPDPARSKPDHLQSYNYVRPLATIEPTAVRFGLPVNTQFGWSDTKGIAAALEAPAYRNSFVLVAWEHKEIVTIAQELMADNGGDSSQIPNWAGEDFDGVYVIRISRAAGSTHTTFERKVEHLDSLPKQCPGEE